MPWSRFRISFPEVILLVISIFCATDSQARDKSTVPDWVKEAAGQSIPQYPSKTEAVVLLYDVQYAVSSQGTAIEHVREVVKLLRPQARREFGTVGTYYDSGSKLLSMHVWSIGPDGHEYAIKDNEMVNQGAGAGFELYSDDMYRSATVPAADAGATVALEFERSSRPYFTDFVFDVQRSIPVVKERLLLMLPQGFSYKAVWKGQPLTEPVDLEHGKTLWEIGNVPAIDLVDVPMAPSARGLEQRLDIHYSGPGIPISTGGDWKSIGEWYAVLAAGRNAPNDAIRQKVKELIAGKNDFADKAQTLAEYVQKNIRYVAIEVGVGGFQPHSAADIFSHGYGDCKDKATLLSAMLDAAGMRGTWVLVDTRRGVVSPDAPSVAGNHMIAAIQLPEGYSSPKFYSLVTATNGKRYLIFDPTWDKTPFGQLEMELQGGYGVLLDGKDTEAIALPVLQPEQNRVSRTASFHLSPDGRLKGAVVERESGDIARGRRELYTSGTDKEQMQALNFRIARDLNAFTVGDVKVENANSLLKDLTVSYDVDASNYSREMGPLLMLRPRVLGNVGFKVESKPRKVPVNLGRTRMVQDEYDIQLPDGYQVDEMPPPAKFDSDFASYESSLEMQDGRLHYKRTFKIKAVTLAANRYDELQKLQKVIENDEQGTAILKKK